MQSLLPLLLAVDATDPERQTALFLLVVFVLLALGVSSMCSIFEAVLLSITPAYVARAEQDGKRSAVKIRALKDHVDQPLATILTLNTIAHTIGAAGAGAQAGIAFGKDSLAIVSAVLTVLILLVSEIIPKSIGAAYWRKLAPVVAICLHALNKLLYPVIWIELKITSLFTKEGHGTLLSREEISAMAQLGAAQGVFDEGESRILKNLFRFSKLTATDIMTPRTVLFTLPEETPVSELIQREKIRFSRIPILKGTSIDEITGYVLVSEVLLGATHGESASALKAFKRELSIVKEDANLTKVFDTILRQQSQIALVVDRFGGTAGLVTLEDLVETLLGMEIVDEVDAVQDMQELARRQWRRRAKRLGLIDDESQDPLDSKIVQDAVPVETPAAEAPAADASADTQAPPVEAGGSPPA